MTEVSPTGALDFHAARARSAKTAATARILPLHNARKPAIRSLLRKDPCNKDKVAGRTCLSISRDKVRFMGVATTAKSGAARL